MSSRSFILRKRSARRHAAHAGRIHLGLIFLFGVLVLLGAAIVTGALILPSGERIATGVSYAGRPLGGKTRDEANTAIKHVLDDTIAHSITLVAGEHTRDVTVTELGFRADDTAIARNAYAVGREGALFTRLQRAARARWAGLDLPTPVSLERDRLEGVLSAFGNTMHILPVDASVTWDDTAKVAVITREKRGAKLDEPASVKLIIPIVQDAMAANRALPEKIELPYREKVPRITAEMLKPVDAVLGTYTTSFATSSRNRASNVTTAAKAVDNTILLSGETFSFNKTVGPRTRDAGFVTAPVIVDGQLQPGIGGGICQVSTTLYNAVLLGNLEIVQRSHHSLPIHYAPPGRDATVSYGAIDFRFKNNTDAPVMVDTVVNGRRLTMRILGKGPAPNVRIVQSGIRALPGRTITKKDPALPKGTRVVEQQGTSGKAVTVTRIVGEGPNAKREVLSNDRYLGEATIVRIGTGPAPVDPSAQKDPTVPDAAAPADPE